LELILPAANTDWRGLALAEFARWADPAGDKRPVVLIDNAGGPVAKRRAVPPKVVRLGGGTQWLVIQAIRYYTFGQINHDVLTSTFFS
jgi:hypothetical protein